jgi:Flp pilus assembly protein TadG
MRLTVLAKRSLVRAMCRALSIRDTSGTAAIEFGLIAPVLLLMIIGMFVFGIAIHDYLTVTNAAEAGAFQLAISRGDSTPYTDTTNAIYGAGPTLSKGQLTITLTINGSTCSSDSSCLTALNSAAGKSATVTVSYPCKLSVLGNNYFPNCTLTARPTERIQ